MKTNIIQLIFCFLLLVMFKGQAQDTTTVKPDESWRNFYIPRTLLRIGIGMQKARYMELGFTRRKYDGEDMFVLGTAYYGALEWNSKLGKKNDEDIYGVKMGAEISLQPILFGIETKYLTNFRTEEYILTPRIGFGGGAVTGTVMSSIYFCYGYNISFSKRPFPGIGGHQFSIIVNPISLSYLLNKKNFKKKLY